MPRKAMLHRLTSSCKRFEPTQAKTLPHLGGHVEERKKSVDNGRAVLVKCSKLLLYRLLREEIKGKGKHKESSDTRVVEDVGL